MACLLVVPLPGVAGPGPSAGEAAAETLPVVVHGVWHKDDESGRGQCERYRALPGDIGQSDEEWIPLVGSIVVTPALVHEFSEYGEGALSVVRAVSRFDSEAWRVKVQVGIDSMPSEDFQVENYVLALRQQRLYWHPEGTSPAEDAGYFRCGDVRRDPAGVVEVEAAD